MYHFSDPQLQELIGHTHLSKVLFTQKLKTFYKEKKCKSSQDCPIDPDDARALFLMLREKVSDTSLGSDDQYNTARLTRLSLSWKVRESIFIEMRSDILGYIKENALHANGNVRNEMLFLLADFLFLMDMTTGPRYPRKDRNKKEQKHADTMFPILIDYHRYLVSMEDDYIRTHHDELSEDDMGYDGEFIPYSGDTHDKTLARIRRILECMDYPYIMREFAQYGYSPYQEEVIPSDCDQKMLEHIRNPLIDTTVFQKDLQLFIMFSGIPTTVADIQKRILYAETLNMHGNRDYNEWFISLLEGKNIELTQEILDIFTTAWNVFPHQRLGGLSPQQKAKELYGDR